MEQQSQSHHHISPDDPSPKNMLWGLIFALLTFLLVVICVTSINLIGKEVPEPPEAPLTPNDPIQTGDDPSGPAENKSPTGADDSAALPKTDPDSASDDTLNPSYLLYTVSGVTEEMISRTQNSEAGVYSSNAIIADASSNTILAGYNADERIYPASMTKVMTLLVACEHLSESDYDAKVTMSGNIISEMERQNASGFGFQAGDVVTVRDLLYAVALESDCAAAIQLAEYVAGSHDAFVRMMNEKCDALELMNTHFTNATGLHGNDHYTTCREMASIMAAAVANPQVLTFLSEDVYVTYIYRTVDNVPNTRLRVTFNSTYFVDVMKNGPGNFYMLPDGAHVIAAKTGSTDEAGKCLVTCVRSSTGKNYVIVTAGAGNPTLYCIDLKYIYMTYSK